MDWGSLGDRSGIILGLFYNRFVRFWDRFWKVYHRFLVQQMTPTIIVFLLPARCCNKGVSGKLGRPGTADDGDRTADSTLGEDCDGGKNEA